MTSFPLIAVAVSRGIQPTNRSLSVRPRRTTASLERTDSPGYFMRSVIDAVERGDDLVLLARCGGQVVVGLGELLAFLGAR